MSDGIEHGEEIVTGTGGAPLFLRWVVPDRPRAGVLLVHGYGEHSGRYAHVMEALASRGLAVLAPDHQGHGRSAQIPGFIEDAERLVSDLGVAHRRLLRLVPGPTLGLAHSMGALLLLRYLERFGDEFIGAVINAPAMQVPERVPWWIRGLARGVARIAPTTPMQPFFNPVRNTRDVEVHRAVMADPLAYRGWVRAGTGVEVMRLITETRRDLGRITLPLLITHGTDDEQVLPEISRGLIPLMGTDDVRLLLFEGLRHETHQEPERDEVVAAWGDWMQARLSG